ncbi:hypothetical protein, partial [Klebsiella aerogenes]|uniref:hypothetical protein n=1 Tax=Klebsiella aerogenes TaxID=548 RepID=UPI0013D7224C
PEAREAPQQLEAPPSQPGQRQVIETKAPDRPQNDQQARDKPHALLPGEVGDARWTRPDSVPRSTRPN